MGMMTAALVTLAAVTVGSQIAGGYAANKEAERNARLYEEQAGVQAGMIDERKRIEAGQYGRAIGRARGTGTARTAGAGLMLSGSPLAVMIDTETQMRLDMAIGQYNLDVNRRNVIEQGRMTAYGYRKKGKEAKRAGYSNAFMTLLTTAGRV